MRNPSSWPVYIFYKVNHFSCRQVHRGYLEGLLHFGSFFFFFFIMSCHRSIPCILSCQKLVFKIYSEKCENESPFSSYQYTIVYLTLQYQLYIPITSNLLLNVQVYLFEVLNFAFEQNSEMPTSSIIYSKPVNSLKNEMACEATEFL